MFKMGKGLNAFLVILGVVGFLMLVGIVGYLAIKSTGTQQSTINNIPSSIVSTNDCSQNPSVSNSFTNSLTGQSVTTTTLNYKDSNSKLLLGSGASLTVAQKVTPIVNASGYITAIQPEYTVKCGNQNLIGNLKQFTNATITLKANSGIAAIGGTLGATGNDSAFTTSANNEVKFVGASYKSTGRQFVVYEVSTTTNVSQVTLSCPAGVTVNPVTVPNCYSNSITAVTPYRAAWEISPIDNGATAVCNLQTVSANGNNVGGIAYFKVYNEQDGVDSLNGNYLTNGICDSNNRFFGIGAVISTSGAPASTSALVGQTNSWYFS